MKFVSIVFAIALVIAGAYFLFLTPGELKVSHRRMRSTRIVNNGLW